MRITATMVFTLDPVMLQSWDQMNWDGSLEERLADVILIEPGFGLALESVEDAELTGGEA